MEVLGYLNFYMKLPVAIENIDVAIGACWKVDALNAGEGNYTVSMCAQFKDVSFLSDSKPPCFYSHTSLVAMFQKVKHQYK